MEQREVEALHPNHLEDVLDEWNVVVKLQLQQHQQAAQLIIIDLRRILERPPFEAADDNPSAVLHNRIPGQRQEQQAPVQREVLQETPGYRRQVAHDEPNVLEHLARRVGRVDDQAEHPNVLLEIAQLAVVDEVVRVGVASDVNREVHDDAADVAGDVEVEQQLVEVLEEDDVALQQTLRLEGGEEGSCCIRWKRQLVEDDHGRQRLHQVGQAVHQHVLHVVSIDFDLRAHEVILHGDEEQEAAEVEDLLGVARRHLDLFQLLPVEVLRPRRVVLERLPLQQPPAPLEQLDDLRPTLLSQVELPRGHVRVVPELRDVVLEDDAEHPVHEVDGQLDVRLRHHQWQNFFHQELGGLCGVCSGENLLEKSRLEVKV